MRLRLKQLFISNAVILVIIYSLIFIQYPLGVGITQLIWHKNVMTAMEPGLLLLWAFVRVGIILPLIFILLQRLSWSSRDIFIRFGNYKKVIAITFWFTFAFAVIGSLSYSWFLRTTSLSATAFVSYLPIFLVYAVSNAFVEETFFRGVLQNYFSIKLPSYLAITFQAILFSAIHLYSPMSSNVWLFVGLTLVLGLVWGYLTEHYKSLFPAIVLHVLADIFVAVSLF